MVTFATDLAFVATQIVHAVGDRLAVSGITDDEVVDAGTFGLSWPRPARRPFLKSPTRSFFFVSTENAGCPRRCAGVTVSAIYRNCASRSGARRFRPIGGHHRACRSPHR